MIDFTNNRYHMSGIPYYNLNIASPLTLIFQNNSRDEREIRVLFATGLSVSRQLQLLGRNKIVTRAS